MYLYLCTFLFQSGDNNTPKCAHDLPSFLDEDFLVYVIDIGGSLYLLMQLLVNTVMLFAFNKASSDDGSISRGSTTLL